MWGGGVVDKLALFSSTYVIDPLQLNSKIPSKRVSKKVLEYLQTVKSIYREWVCAGKPQHGQIYLENKLAKKCLRQQQRLEETVRRKNFFQSPMENPSTDMFYRLIRQSKSRKESTTTCTYCGK